MPRPQPSKRIPWPEAAMEALGLALFMISAGVCATLLESPRSPIRQAIASAVLRRGLMGLAVGLTAIGLAHSPWGKRSGAHLNPAVTWTFFRLGRTKARVALAYTLAQFAGGLAGVGIAAIVAGKAFLAPPVSSIATVPASPAGAFLAELLISGLLMFVILRTGSSPSFSRHTTVLAGALLFVYITVEAPISGMSMNPARTFASALSASQWKGIWIYFIAPVAGMLAAADLFQRTTPHGRGCAKLVHRLPCLFCGATPANERDVPQESHRAYRAGLDA